MGFQAVIKAAASAASLEIQKIRKKCENINDFFFVFRQNLSFVVLEKDSAKRRKQPLMDVPGRLFRGHHILNPKSNRERAFLPALVGTGAVLGGNDPDVN